MSTTHVQSYDMIGKKEQVDDVISLITPSDTPFLSMIGKAKKIKSTFFEWMEDDLRSVAKNAKLEGFEASDSVRDQPSKRSNYSQIFSETFKVSGTSDAVEAYGRQSETARELAKTGKNIKRDLEHSLVGTGQTAVAGVDGVTAREFAGYQAMIHADTTEDAATAALTEVMVQNVHEKLYNKGGDASILMIKPTDAKIVAGFADSANRTRDIGQEKKVVNAVNFLVNPYGEVKVVLNRLQRTSDALMFDAGSWELKVLRPWFREMLAKTGDAERHMLVGEYSLKHDNFKKSGIIVNLT